MELDAPAVAARLGLVDQLDWLTGLEQVGPPAEPVVLPTEREAAALLERLAVAEQDRAEIVASLPLLAGDPALRWTLERAHHRLLREAGAPTGQSSLPRLPYQLGAAARYFHVHLFLVTAPAALRRDAAHGVPAEVTWHTLAQLGEMVALHRRESGTGGMDSPGWLSLHLRGVIHRLGRLQFERVHWRGEPVLNVHIPSVGGPLTPESCEDSLRRAGPFFAAHFPDHGATRALCHSWLLDPQLAEYLPEDSNVVRFMRRWQPTEDRPLQADDAVLKFVFRRKGTPLDQLPQRTTLERAAVAHLRAGRHWYAPFGRVELA